MILGKNIVKNNAKIGYKKYQKNFEKPTGTLEGKYRKDEEKIDRKNNEIISKNHRREKQKSMAKI